MANPSMANPSMVNNSMFNPAMANPSMVNPSMGMMAHTLNMDSSDGQVCVRVGPADRIPMSRAPEVRKTDRVLGGVIGKSDERRRFFREIR
jgi:hypothetical protein